MFLLLSSTAAGIMDQGGIHDSASSSSSDSKEEFTSLSSSASSSPPQHQLEPPATSLHDMSSLSQHLPFKRGLSKYYQGKSQSFTSLSAVRCLEDLAKPEKPYSNKKLKSCKSYGGEGGGGGGGGLSEETLQLPKRILSRKASRERERERERECRLLLGSRPPIPIPPHTSPTTNRISNQTPLFA